MLDLKAKLAAAGVVTKEQVDKFDKDQAAARTKKRIDQAKAEERKAARTKYGSAKQGNGNRGNAKQGNGNRGNAKQGNGNRGNAKQSNGNRNRGHTKPNWNKRPEDSDPSGINVAALRALNRGDAYARIRKIVEHSRLDDKERTIPRPDDQIFNFVTSKGKVSRLYLTSETAKGLAGGQTAISSFMSHHGLSHCVLPALVAVALAEVFPLWLRHLVGNDAAGLIEEPEAPSEKEARSNNTKVPSKKEARSNNTKAPSEVVTNAKGAEALSEVMTNAEDAEALSEVMTNAEDAEALSEVVTNAEDVRADVLSID